MVIPDYFSSVEPGSAVAGCESPGCVLEADSLAPAEGGAALCDGCLVRRGFSLCEGCEKVYTKARGLDGAAICGGCQTVRTESARDEMIAAAGRLSVEIAATVAAAESFQKGLYL